MARIDYFFTTISPFVYLAGTRLEEVAARHGAQIHYRPVGALALFKRTGGTAPADRHENRKAYRLQELRRQSAKLDMPLVLHPANWPTNPAPSGYAIIAAQKAQGGDVGALAHGLARACWAQERDVAEDEVIRSCLEEAGFDPKLAESGMLEGAEAYSANLEKAVALGAFGVPFYVVDESECFWGQDRLDDLDLYLAGKL